MPREYVLQPFRSQAELRIDYFHELNEQQHAAVTSPPGPALVIAGAGSGKTRALVYRVAYLLENGIPPERILLLTFTNKAAREMMRRASELLGGDLASLWGGTFHSIGNRVLRRHAALLGWKPDFTILDREDAKDLIQACIGTMQIDIKETRFPKPDVAADIFSLSVNKDRTIEATLREQYDYFLALAPQIQELFNRYAERKRASNAMDFDDLLRLWLQLLRSHPEVREEYQRRFQFLLVDEYQDTNKIQGEIVDLLAERHHNVFVVGDDSQSIYSWRGAHFENILKFPDRYPGAKVFRIETNYRSTPEILAAANASIRHNVRQFAKELTSARQPGIKPVVVTCGDSAEQAAFVAQRVLELRDEGTSLSNMAVLYRSHFHALELQMEFTRRNIPFSITSGIRFFEQAHIKDVAAYIKLVSNPRDELAFKRLAHMLPGVGGKSAEKLWTTFARAQEDTPLAMDAKHPLATRLQACAASVPKKSATAWAQFLATISQLEEPPVRSSASQMIRLVLDAGYQDYLQEEFPNYRARQEDLEQLSVFAQQFETVEDFLSQLALQTNVEAETETAGQRKDEEQIRLSTIHQAKGLEYDVVFMIMLCEGLFPSNRSLDSTEGEEEERRLFYVAMTRARNELYLSYPVFRVTPGAADAFQQPSRFIKELPADLIEEWNLRSFNPYA
jgi:DNA helicase-2/ATP-dependent DNA helicase PcrA